MQSIAEIREDRLRMAEVRWYTRATEKEKREGGQMEQRRITMVSGNAVWSTAVDERGRPMADEPAVSPRPTVTGEWKLIGSTEAMAMLEAGRGILNRPVQDMRVKRLAADMRDGRWLCTAESIKFSADGQLFDGQHRLWAVIDSGIAVWFFVVRGITAEAMTAVDTGKGRSLADFLRMWGVASHFATAGVITKMWRWEHRRTFVVASRALSDSPSGQQAQAYYEAHSEEIKYSVLRTRRNGISSLGFSGISAAVHMILNRIDPTDCEDFFVKLESGAGLVKGDAILLLRSRMLDARGSQVKPSDALVAALQIKAWNAYRQGRPMFVLGWRPGGANPELFPLPV